MKKSVIGLAAVAVLTIAGALPLATSMNQAEAAPGWGLNRVDFCIDPVFAPNFTPRTIKIAEPAVARLVSLGLGTEGACAS